MVARAGLEVGDVVVSLRLVALPQGEARTISTCWEWWRAEVDTAPRGPLELVFRRGGARRTARLAAGEWRAEVEPNSETHPETALCRVWNRAADAERRRNFAAALPAYQEVMAAAKARRDEPFEAQATVALGRAQVGFQQFEEGGATLRRAVELTARALPGTLFEAQAWHQLGRLYRLRGRLEEAESGLRRALALRTELAPRSLERSYTLNNLGIVAFSRTDLRAAQALYEESLELVRALAPGSEDEAQMLANLGLVARDLGDLKTAEALCRQAHELSARLDPEGPGLGRDLINLAAIVSDRGDLARAAGYLWQALERYEKLEPQSLATANLLFNLGTNLRDRGELARSEELLRRALGLHRKLSPGSLLEATDLASLSWVVAELGRLDEAVALARESLALRERLAPGSPEHANGLGTLSQVLARREDIGPALVYAEQGMRILEATVPNTRFHAFALESLGNLALKAGQPQRALKAIQRSIDIRVRVQPGQQWLATSYHLLAHVHATQHRFPEAEKAYLAAVAVAEEQGERVGRADETQVRFNRRYSDLYHQLITLQVRAGWPDRALATLERSRGRALLAQLAVRDLAFASDLPRELGEERRRLDREWELAQRHPDDRTLMTLERLRGERERLTERIVAASPRYAALVYPRPLDLDGARAALDAETLWLSYSVGPDASWLFMLAGQGDSASELQVVELPIGAAELGREVAALRGLILSGREQPGQRAALDQQRQRLSAWLLAPAAAAIARAERLLISPDGPLHILPFGALTPPGAAEGYLIERLPVHLALSATVYSELARSRKPQPLGAGVLAVLADPTIEPLAVADGEALDGSRGRHAGGLPPLPAGRLEAEALRQVFGDRAQVFAGPEATETRLRKLPAETRWLHFAGHALLDEQSPLESALALATPKRPSELDNGLLEAWEIFEQLRLPLELVTLSACDTGLGEEAGGEGLLGLSRAFQYAGARSVVASLWPVSDRSTSRLMAAFYRALAGGASKAEALALAQRELLRATDSDLAGTHPYHWAAFELIGDWQ